MAIVDLNIKRTIYVKRVERQSMWDFSRVYYDWDGKECYLQFDEYFTENDKLFEYMKAAMLLKEPVDISNDIIKIKDNIWIYYPEGRTWVKQN